MLTMLADYAVQLSSGRVIYLYGYTLGVPLTDDRPFRVMSQGQPVELDAAERRELADAAIARLQQWAG
jgi:hypothetical protein